MKTWIVIKQVLLVQKRIAKENIMWDFKEESLLIKITCFKQDSPPSLLLINKPSILYFLEKFIYNKYK